LKSEKLERCAELITPTIDRKRKTVSFYFNVKKDNFGNRADPNVSAKVIEIHEVHFCTPNQGRSEHADLTDVIRKYAKPALPDFIPELIASSLPKAVLTMTSADILRFDPGFIGISLDDRKTTNLGIFYPEALGRAELNALASPKLTNGYEVYFRVTIEIQVEGHAVREKVWTNSCKF